MNFGVIGYFSSFNHKCMHPIDLKSNYTLLEYDALIIDTKYLLLNYESHQQYNGNRVINESDSSKLELDIKKRHDEIVEFLENGKTVICVSTNEEIVYVYTGKHDFSGTGKNRQKTDIVQDVHSNSVLPFKVNSAELCGNKVCYVNKNIEEKMKKYNSFIEYNSVYSNIDKNNQIMNIEGSKKTVCYYEKVGKGILLFAPNINFGNKSNSSHSKIEKDYFSTLIELTKMIENSDENLPEYSKEYFMPSEKEIVNDIKEKEGKITKIQKEIENQNKKLKEIQKYKILFTGTGKSLEKIVVDILRKIGLSIIKYDENSIEEDIVFEYNNKIFVAEVKGVNGSATEKHTAQTVKWKTEYFIENSNMPKGILIVNAFNNKKLEERQEYFPNQMLKYAKHQEICLLTTIQLYNIMHYLEKNPSEKDKIIQDIFNCNGKYESFDKWDENINK